MRNQMKKLKALYKRISSSVWDRIHFSYNMGFKYSEVTITENLLFDMCKFNIDNPLIAINIFEAKNEKTNGNDLELCLEIEPDKYMIFVIQAKKLYYKEQKYRSLSHKVNDKYQIDLLENYAKQIKAIPLYMLYNYAPDCKKKDKKDYGCSLIFSNFIKKNYYLKIASSRWKIPTFNELHQENNTFPLYLLAMNPLKIKHRIDKNYKIGKDYKIYTKNELISNNKWIGIFDKHHKDYLSYSSNEFEPKYRLMIGTKK